MLQRCSTAAAKLTASRRHLTPPMFGGGRRKLSSDAESIILRSSMRLEDVVVKSPMKLPPVQQMLQMSLPKFVLLDFLHPEKCDLVAIVDGYKHKQLTFKEVHAQCFSFAFKLRQLGIEKFESVAIMSPNTLNYLPVFLGAMMAGARSTCVNPLNTEYELLRQVTAANAKVIVAHPYNLHIVNSVASKVPGCKVIVFDDEIENIMDAKLDQVLKLSEFLKEPIDNIDLDAFLPDNAPNFDPHSIATLPFSSGTTGAMKGVMLTHQNLIANTLQCYPYECKYLQATAIKPRGTLLVPLPFFHIYGLTAGLLCSHVYGAKLLFMPSFDLQKFLELIQQYKVTRGFVVPPIVLALAKHPLVDKYDLSSVDCLMSGAAPLGGDLELACSQRLNCLVKQAWGMTELSPAGTICNDDFITDMGAMKGRSGQLLPGTEAKIVTPGSGTDQRFDQEGELLIRGPQVMKGYLDNEEATNATIRPDGFMHTGDIGYFDSDGWLYITDRVKELIKYKGYQVPPAELEAIILSMPQIKDVVVIPVPDEEAGEIPRAYVVKQDGVTIGSSGSGSNTSGSNSITSEDVVNFVNERVAPHKRLRGGVVFTNEVPKSPSGKLLRRVQIEIDRRNTNSAAEAVTGPR